MTIEERIEKIGKYFVLFNVSQNEKGYMAYVAVRLCDKWAIPNNILSEYNVDIRNGEDRLKYVFSYDITKIDNCFSAVEKIIEYNMTMEKKKDLFSNKIKELQNLFEKHDLQSLELLEFNLPNINDDESLVGEVYENSEEDKSLVGEVSLVEEKTDNENKSKKNKNKGSALMDLAKEQVEA